ncbi:DUF86 domain-containing protein [Candidatus Sumerlaeota bacterium]|nr:DUF86 domain-containing protein [Candidatus Sumerlaeota bacterium]
MKLETRQSLHDALKAAREIQGYLAEVDYAEFQRNGMLQAAVERKFEIVGEALRRLGDAEPQVLERISHYRRIIGFRNIIAHGYDTVDIQIVWEAATSYLPVLIGEVEKIVPEN